MNEGSPISVADALGVLGWPPEEAQLLSSGWHGDSVYAIGTGSTRAVLRCYRLGRPRRWEDPRPLALAGLRDQAELARLMACHGAPIQIVTAGPQLVAPGWASSLLTWIPGIPVTGSTRRLASIVGSLLADLHRIGASLEVERWSALPRHDLVGMARRSIEELSGLVPASFVTDAEDRIAAIQHAGPPIAVHGDLNIPNIVWSDGQPSLVDLDQVGAGWPSEELAWAMKWWSRRDGVGSGTHEGSLSDTLLEGYGTPPDPVVLRPMLWLTGCLNANAVIAIKAGSVDDRPNRLDELRRRADALGALV